MRIGQYELIFYRDETESAITELKDICRSDSEIDSALHKASARTFFNRMARGLLAYDADPAELQEVASQTELLELYPLTPAYLARGYSADPHGIPAIVICLLHNKDVSGSAEEVRDRQNEKMSDAKARFDGGWASRWGSV